MKDKQASHTLEPKEKSQYHWQCYFIIQRDIFTMRKHTITKKHTFIATEIPCLREINIALTECIFMMTRDGMIACLGL